MDSCDRNIVFLCFLGSSDDHFVGYGVGKENHQIRIPNFFLNGAMLFREHLCFTSIVFTDICILTHHSFISTDNYDTHLLYLPFCCYLMLLEISLF